MLPAGRRRISQCTERAHDIASMQVRGRPAGHWRRTGAMKQHCGVVLRRHAVRRIAAQLWTDSASFMAWLAMAFGAPRVNRTAVQACLATP